MLGLQKPIGFIKHLSKYYGSSDSYGVLEPIKAPRCIVGRVKKKYPGFNCYISTIGDDGKPVVVIHKTETQTKLKNTPL